MTFPRERGTYALLFHLDTEKEIRVGRKGVFHLAPGYYVYVGSARGPGGLAARLRRHFSREKRPYWHVDYLTLCVTPVGAIWSTQATAMECAWVAQLLRTPGATVPVRGFGNGDCNNGCPAHLIGIAPDSAQHLEDVVRGDVAAGWEVEGVGGFVGYVEEFGLLSSCVGPRHEQEIPNER